jgi:FkbM family methyltransferase
MNPKLIYDVGVHNGDDTAYYLHKGFRVVGIEANPEAVAQLQARFASPIARGDLLLLDVGVAEREGTIDFYVCNEQSEWSSFNPLKAPNAGATARTVKVSTVTFDSILARYGVPYYCKIDIEGNDILCLDGITPEDKPEYLSIEMSHAVGDRQLAKMAALGYSRFKIVSQVTFGPAVPALESLIRRAPWRLRHAAQSLKQLEVRTLGKGQDDAWTFRRGSSGSFGEATPGRWLSYAKALTVWRSLHRLDSRLNARGFGGDWYDIHATGPG